MSREAAYAEDALLLAVRNRLRLPTNQGGAGYSEAECNIEHDEQAAATSGQVYVAVMPGGWQAGKHHNTSGGISDLLFGVDVLVVKRVGNVPRDRMREPFAYNLQSLNREIDKIFEAVDWNYDLMNLANAIIQAETIATYGFSEPLRFVGSMGRPQIVGDEIFGGTGDGAAMKRTISFHNARRVTLK